MSFQHCKSIYSKYVCAKDIYKNVGSLLVQDVSLFNTLLIWFNIYYSASQPKKPNNVWTNIYLLNLFYLFLFFGKLLIQAKIMLNHSSILFNTVEHIVEVVYE